MSTAQNVLLIEDNPGDARLIREMLAEDRDAPFALHCAERLARGLERSRASEPGLVLLDLSLPDSLGLETFAKVYAHSPTVPIIVLTGNDDQQVALTAVKSGAQDYLIKGKLDRELLVRSMQYSIERKRYQEQLEHQANYDALTGLPNRHLLHDRLRQAVSAQRHARAIAVVFIDLDRFKVVNDTPGPHRRRRAAAAAWPSGCARVLRDGDTVARLGGDEFVLILTDQASEDVIFRAMQRIIGERRRADGDRRAASCPSPAASASASTRRTGPTSTRCSRTPTPRCTAPRRTGRNNFQFYTAEMNERVNERLALEQQPAPRAGARASSCCTTSRRSTCAPARSIGVEALLRWSIPSGADAPGALHPARRGDRPHRAASASGCCATACAQARAWQRRGPSSPASSRSTCRRGSSAQAGWCGRCRAMLEETRHRPAQLELEITESMVMHNAEIVDRHAAGPARRSACALSMDDFGTGYSSLALPASSFPIDALKIDRSFVRDIGDGDARDDGEIAQAIISLATAWA